MLKAENARQGLVVGEEPGFGRFDRKRENPARRGPSSFEPPGPSPLENRVGRVSIGILMHHDGVNAG